MKRLATWLFVFCLAPSAFSATLPPNLNYEILRTIPILDNGRYKPFDTYAGESMENITGRWKFEGHAPVAMLLALASSHDWTHENLVKINYLPLKEALGLDKAQSRFPFESLVENQRFQQLANQVMEKDRNRQKLTHLENEVGKLIHQLNLAQELFHGAYTIVPPASGTGEEGWHAVSDLTAFPQETATKIQEAHTALMTAYTRADNAAFEQASQNLKGLLAGVNPQAYTQVRYIDKEIHYNDFRPFLMSWIFYLIAFLMFLVWYSFPNNKLYYSAYASCLIGFGLHTYGMFLRSIISGRPPVSNMYESVIWVGWGIVFFGLIFELVYRRHWFVTAASGLGVGMLILADILPFDPNIEPLVPVLRSNYWLIVHVLTITISYSIFALAMGLAHVILGVYFLRPNRRDLLKELSLFLYRMIQVGVVLLFAGTVLGGVWAAESWGRFWGWDPKETWALISLLGYLAILHARFTGWLRNFGTAVCSIIGFWLILMTWYGVNFVLAVGLHAYGFGSGGGGYVLGYLGLETLFLGAVAYRYKVLYQRGTLPIDEITPGIESQTPEIDTLVS